MNLNQQLYFRDALKNARASTLDDAEGFETILLVLERLGRFLNGGPGQGLGGFKKPILQQCAKSPLADTIPSRWPEWHIDIEVLYDQFRLARNDAVHEGALARRYTTLGISLAIVLEDALMAEREQIGHFMVRTPVCAETWQPLSFIRQTLLSHSFSYMPVNVGTSQKPEWRLVSDIGIATFLRGVSANYRAKRLGSSLENAVETGEIRLEVPFTCSPGTLVSQALSESRGLPILVVAEGSMRLLGIATAFDLL